MLIPSFASFLPQVPQFGYTFYVYKIVRVQRSSNYYTIIDGGGVGKGTCTIKLNTSSLTNKIRRYSVEGIAVASTNQG